MADWLLVPCLVTLRDEFNKIAPNRDKTSDGSIGDAAHRKTKSDHNPDETGSVPTHDADKINEVHGLDVDANLRNPLITMEWCIRRILNECRKPGTSGKDRGRLKYIIYNKRIWEADNNWEQRSYTGKNPHDKHAHFSAEYTTEFEYDTRPWGLVDSYNALLIPPKKEELPVDQKEFNKLFATALKEADEEFVANFAKAIFQVKVPDFAEPKEAGEKRRELTLAQWFGWSDGRADVGRVEDKVRELEQKIDSIHVLITEIRKYFAPYQSRGAVNL